MKKIKNIPVNFLYALFALTIYQNTIQAAPPLAFISPSQIRIEYEKKFYLANIVSTDKEPSQTPCLLKIPMIEIIECSMSHEPLTINTENDSDTQNITSTITIKNPFSKKLCYSISSYDGHWIFLSNKNDGLLIFIDQYSVEKCAKEQKTLPLHIDESEEMLLATFSDNNKYLLIITKELMEGTKTTTFNMVVIDLETQEIKHNRTYNFFQKLYFDQYPDINEEISDNDLFDDIPFNFATISPDGNKIATLSHKGELRIIDLEENFVTSSKELILIDFCKGFVAINSLK